MNSPSALVPTSCTAPTISTIHVRWRPLISWTTAYSISSWPCPLWVISRHNGPFKSRPLYPQQRTFVSARGMSAKCQKQTLAIEVPGFRLSAPLKCL